MPTTRSFRVAVAVLSLSAAGYGATVAYEQYSESAIIPTRGDRPTVGLGSTFREDGSPVELGDRITPPKAIARSLAHIAKNEAGLKKCVTGAMSQVEYDILVDFTYQYGVAVACKSSMVRAINAGDYTAACEAYILYKRAGGRDCSLPENRRICGGVWTRSLERRAKCMKGLT